MQSSRQLGSCRRLVLCIIARLQSYMYLAFVWMPVLDPGMQLASITTLWSLRSSREERIGLRLSDDSMPLWGSTE